MHQPDEATRAQLAVIRDIASVLDGAGVSWWLYGGWAMDFHAGAIMRDHSDIELFAWESDVATIRALLTACGFVAPDGLYPDECQSFVKDRQEIGVWFLVRGADGSIRTPGRWQDWPWERGSFDGPRARLLGIEAPVMSIAGLLDIKENFARHPHGAPLREKDRTDIATLRRLKEQT